MAIAAAIAAIAVAAGLGLVILGRGAWVAWRVGDTDEWLAALFFAALLLAGGITGVSLMFAR